VPEAGEEKGNKKEKKGSRKVLLIIAAVVVIAVPAAAAFNFFGGGKAGSPSPKNSAHENKKQMVDLSDIIVNLADKGSNRYLRLKIVLEFPENKKLDEEIKRKAPQIKDALIAILRNKTTTDIQAAGGSDEIKKQILQKLNNEYLTAGKVENIYFTDLLVQ